MNHEDLIALAKHVKKTFDITGKRDRIMYNKRILALSKRTKPYSSLDPAMQDYLLDQVVDPNLLETTSLTDAPREVRKYVYASGRIPAREFPVSAWEEIVTEFIERVQTKQWESPTISMAKRIQKIINIQEQIEKKGYDPTKPIILEGVVLEHAKRQFKDTKTKLWEFRDVGLSSKFWVENGHHRLQAIRNLIKAGKLPRGFSPPVIVRFEKGRSRVTAS